MKQIKSIHEWLKLNKKYQVKYDEAYWNNDNRKMKYYLDRMEELDSQWDYRWMDAEGL